MNHGNASLRELKTGVQFKESESFKAYMKELEKRISYDEVFGLYALV